MYFAKEGRKDYLDFIKNIPIQALLFFISGLFFHGGLPGRPTAMKIAIGIVFCLMALGAALASSSLFVESLRKNLVHPENQRARDRYPSIDGASTAKWAQIARRGWFRRRALVEVIIALVIIDLAFVAVLISAMISAFSALHISIPGQH